MHAPVDPSVLGRETGWSYGVRRSSGLPLAADATLLVLATVANCMVAFWFIARRLWQRVLAARRRSIRDHVEMRRPSTFRRLTVDGLVFVMEHSGRDLAQQRRELRADDWPAEKVSLAFGTSLLLQ